MDITKTITAKLSLNAVDFTKNLSSAEKSLLKFSAVSTGMLASLGALAKSTANYNDNIAETAKKVGTTASQYSELAYAAQLTGTETDALGKTLAKLTAPTDKMISSMAELGVKVKDSSGKIRDQKDILFDLADSLKNFETPAEKAGKLIEIFGRKGADMATMLGEGSDELKKLVEEANQFGIVVSEKAVQQSGKFNDNLDRMAAAARGATKSIGDSIVEFVNSTGILEKMSKAISSLTQWWSSLDDRVKKIIVSFVAIASGLGAIAGAIVVLGPAVTALGAIFAGVTAPVIAVGAAIAGVTLAIAVLNKSPDPMPIKDPEKFKKQTELITNRKVAIEDLTKSIHEQNAISLRELTNAPSGPADNPYEIPGQEIVEAGNRIRERAAREELARQEKLRQENQKKYEEFLRTEAGRKHLDEQRFARQAREAEEVNALVGMYENAYKKEKSFFEKLTDGAEELADSLSSVMNVVGMIADSASIGVDIAGGFADLASAEAARATAIMERNTQVQIMKLQKLMEAKKTVWEHSFQQQADMVSKFYDDEIAALTEQEDRKLAIQEQAAAERKLAKDKEYQDEKAARESAFAKQLEFERMRYESEKNILLQGAYDKEQARLVEAVMDEDFKKYIENLQKDHDGAMAEWTKEFNTTAATEDEAAKVAEADRANKAAEKLAELEEKKAKKLAKIEERKNEKLQELEEKAARQEEKLRMRMVRKQWQATKAEYENNKALRKADALVAGMAAAATAFSTVFASRSILGPAIAGGLAASAAGLIMEVTRRKIDQINEMKPVKPAELMMAKGGVVGGSRSHSLGGMDVNLESGEAVLDRVRTEKFIKAADDQLGRGKVININFQTGAIQTAHPLDDPRTMEKFSRELAYRLEKII